LKDSEDNHTRPSSLSSYQSKTNAPSIKNSRRKKNKGNDFWTEKPLRRKLSREEERKYKGTTNSLEWIGP